MNKPDIVLCCLFYVIDNNANFRYINEYICAHFSFLYVAAFSFNSKLICFVFFICRMVLGCQTEGCISFLKLKKSLLQCWFAMGEGPMFWVLKSAVQCNAYNFVDIPHPTFSRESMILFHYHYHTTKNISKNQFFFPPQSYYDYYCHTLESYYYLNDNVQYDAMHPDILSLLQYVVREYVSLSLNYILLCSQYVVFCNWATGCVIRFCVQFKHMLHKRDVVCFVFEAVCMTHKFL